MGKVCSKVVKPLGVDKLNQSNKCRGRSVEKDSQVAKKKKVMASPRREVNKKKFQRLDQSPVKTVEKFT